ncbi:MAG: hypothetical protein EOL87_09130 [Spartobacteria bacterium]|nr:hypothetical protein [Spartobacteria bacterium]
MNNVRYVTFNVATAKPLPVGEQVFLSGNDVEFGGWDPCGLALTRERDNLWSTRVELPADIVIEFKVTRGSWLAEQVAKDGLVPPNYVLEAGTDDAEFDVYVHHWKDMKTGILPDIVGEFRILEEVESRILNNSRTVIVWLPPSYEKEQNRHFPVLYMHDGQQIFDPATSTWDKAWDVDVHMTDLIAEGLIQEAIVVAPYSSEFRRSEYNPDDMGDDYLKFLIHELKPQIDEDYRTHKDRCYIAGSSMGGLMSFYAAWKHPDVFAKAAVLSPAFKIDESETIFDMVKSTKKCPDIHMYLYCGGGDPLEKRLLGTTRQMVELLRKKGFEKVCSAYVEDDKAAHNEEAWEKHTREWLTVLLGS